MTAARTDDRRTRFEAIFEAELTYVWTSLRRLGVAERDLEDIAHELFLKVHAQLDVYDPTRPVRPWLFAFAFRAAADYRKLRRHKDELLGDREPGSGTSPTAEQALHQKEREALVAEVLAELEIERRAVFILHELDEVPMPAIAETLGIPVNTGYSRLRTAREEFTMKIKKRMRARGEAQ